MRQETARKANEPTNMMDSATSAPSVHYKTYSFTPEIGRERGAEALQIVCAQSCERR